MPPGRRFDSRQPQQYALRTNQRIRVPEVRVVDESGTLLGVLPTHEALRLARQRGLDLVELNPKDSPPLCKILDYGKYKYEEDKKKRRAGRMQMSAELKEVKLRPKTDDHDLDFKANAARRFIEAGNKVKFTVRFRGREITHPEKAREQLDTFVKRLEDIANVESRPTLEGRAMILLMAPKDAVRQRAAQAKAQREREREQALREGRTPLPEPEELASLDDDDDDDDDDEAETDAKDGAKADAKDGAKADAKDGAKAEDGAKADVKDGARAETKDGAKAGAKTDAKAEVKDGAKAETKVEA